MKSILDRSFRYTPAAATDVAKTIRKALRAQRRATLVVFLYTVLRVEERRWKSEQLRHCVVEFAGMRRP